MRARLFCLVLAGIALTAPLRADTWRRADAEDLLKRWCDALVARQVTNSADAKLNGGILCPACMFLHGRIADLSYPLAHLYAKTGDRRYLDAATKAVDFVEANLVGADGRVYNDVKHTWWGITVFSQVAFCKALLAYGERLPPDVRARWTAICRRETDFMLAFFEKPDFRPNVNYPVAYCEAMVLAGRLFDEPKYTAAGRDKAHALTAAFVAEDGLLVGEGHPSDAVSPRGCRFVDLGYNMEESLDALAEVADALRDETLAARVERSALAHLAFMLPDGGLDNSVGSRSAKWTYYGSRTSDGLLPILGFLARRGHPEAVRAIRLHLGLLRRCTLANGLLAGGLMHAEADEPACAHHAFAHAKSLVDLIRSATPETAQDALLPREKAVGRTHYPTLDADLVACGPWRATFTANDMYSQRPGTSVSGGSLSLLYHLGLGPVLVGTMSVYTLVEPANMQDQRHDDATVTFTPRLVSGKAVSCADWKAKTTCTCENGVCTYAAEGCLADDASRTEPRRSRDTFRQAFRLDEKGLRIEATSSAATWQYRLPVIATPHDVVTVEGCSATIRRDAGTIRLTASKPLRLVRTRRGERIWTPVAGLLAADFALDAAAGETVTLNLTAETQTTADLSPAEMQAIYDTVKTPCKHGVILSPAKGHMLDNPTVFRHADKWYMLYIDFDGKGYETHLAVSDDLLRWQPLGCTFRRGGPDAWDRAQADGWPILLDPDWHGSNALGRFENRYGMMYIGGAKDGYETDPLSEGIAWSDDPTRLGGWVRDARNPVLSPSDPDARPFEKATIYKSFVVEDPTRRCGGRFALYYNAKQQGKWVERIGMAVSDDLRRWRRVGSGPCVCNTGALDNGICGDPMVRRIGETYVMFFFGYNWKGKGDKAFDTFAASKDLMHWTRWNGPKLVEPSEPWDAVHAHKPWVICHNGVVYHFYCAVGSQGRVLALATSKPLK